MTRAASHTSPRAFRPGGARPSPWEDAWAMSCAARPECGAFGIKRGSQAEQSAPPELGAALGRTAVPGLTRNLLPHAAGVLS